MVKALYCLSHVLRICGNSETYLAMTTASCMQERAPVLTIGRMLAILCILFDSSCGTPGSDAPSTVSCGVCKTFFANHLQKGRHDKKFKGSCRHLLLTSEHAAAPHSPQLTRSASGRLDPTQSPGTPVSWEEHDIAEACQPRFNHDEDSASDCSSDSVGSRDAPLLEALEPPFDASFEIANFTRRAGLPWSMV